jgi:hypothetical protein
VNFLEHYPARITFTNLKKLTTNIEITTFITELPSSKPVDLSLAPAHLLVIPNIQSCCLFLKLQATGANTLVSSLLCMAMTAIPGSSQIQTGELLGQH